MEPSNAVVARLGVKTFTAIVGSESDIQNAIAGLGREPGSGLIVMSDGHMTVHRKSIIELTASHKVSAIY